MAAYFYLDDDGSLGTIRWKYSESSFALERASMKSNDNWKVLFDSDWLLILESLDDEERDERYLIEFSTEET